MALSSSGLGLIVFAILRSSVWGFVKPRTPPTINGTEITPLGFSPVPFLVLGGLALLGAFFIWEQRRARLGRDQLLDTTLLRVAQLRAGLSSLLGQQLVLMGTFFVIPVYLQVVLGLDAFETGKRLLPLSLAMLVFALLGPRIAARRSPRTVAQLGLVAVSIGAIVMLATLDVTLNDTGFKIGARPHRRGCRPARLAAGERHHVLGRARQEQRGGRAPGHRPESRLLARDGDHRRGAARVARDGLQPSASPTTPTFQRPPARRSLRTPKRGSTSCPWTDVEKAAVEGGLTQDQAQAVATDYGDAQLEALRLALGAVAAAALLSLWFTRRLPTESLAEDESRRPGAGGYRRLGVSPEQSCRTRLPPALRVLSDRGPSLLPVENREPSTKPREAYRAARLIVLVTTLVSLAGGVLIWLLDHREFPDLGTSLWWSLQTVTTVGYGDVTPGQTGGRIIGAVLMLQGIGFITVVAASVTASLIDQARRRRAGPADNSLSEKLERLDARLEAIERILRDRHS